MLRQDELRSHYPLTISDGNGYCTTHTFERQDLWDWMNEQVEFPPGAVDVDVPMTAGYPPAFDEAPTPEAGWPAGSATAHINSTENDLAKLVSATAAMRLEFSRRL